LLLQSVERLVYKLDRRTLIDPDLVMSSMGDLSLLALMPAVKPRPRSNPNRGDRGGMASAPLQAPAAHASSPMSPSIEKESPRIPLPNSVAAMLQQYVTTKPQQPTAPSWPRSTY
jgi:hypothetical protein